MSAQSFRASYRQAKGFGSGHVLTEKELTASERKLRTDAKQDQPPGARTESMRNTYLKKRGIVPLVPNLAIAEHEAKARVAARLAEFLATRQDSKTVFRQG